MFTTLVESRGIRARSAYGAVLSVVLHGATIAAAVALTMPSAMEARPEDDPKPLVFIPAPSAHRSAVPRLPAPREDLSPPGIAQLLSRVIPMPPVAPNAMPPIELQGPELPDHVIIAGPHRGANLTGGTGGSGEVPVGGIVSENMVDEVPRMIGSVPAPRYPAALRDGGISGRVVVRFVVDTLGRAELGDVVVVETTHALFTDAVKNVLERYRFRPGAVEGHKVRTMVQLPFTFSLRP